TTVNPGFPLATRFLGDYSNIALDPAGDVAALWTDLRVPANFRSTTGAGPDAFFALVAPPPVASTSSQVGIPSASSLLGVLNGSGATPFWRSRTRFPAVSFRSGRRPGEPLGVRGVDCSM